MTPLSSLASTNALFRGTANLVRAFKQPRLKSEDFASVLKAQLNKKPATSAEIQQARQQTALLQSAQLMKSRDADTDSLLTKDEAGLAPELFKKLDLDADGRLSQDELKAGYLAALSGAGPAMPIQEKES